MILPIVAYGDPVLKKVAEEIDKDYPGLQQLIADMFETMYNANGVGLAAPQIGKSIRLFIVDASPFAEDDEDGENEHLKDFKKVFINPIIEDETGEEWGFNEGCLSIPGIREEVFREEKIKISYYDENFNFFEEEYDGFAARVIQHEYDHIEGVLFTDKISPLRRRLLKRRLEEITIGDVDVNYKMRFPKK
ncbi:MAG TPA: peptide deformylase [Flavobacteriales bacterium]|nr:peptide deformylase [Flavobacteriales bacterium]HRE96326.1 peptide deformylase [Flavobacteriales bacterium]HRJ37839.1 peptide deformylase [Flavobacteriales bacterium]